MLDRISGPPRDSAEASVRVRPPIDDEISVAPPVPGTRVTGPLSWPDAAGREHARHSPRHPGLAAAVRFILEALRADKDTGSALERERDIGLQRLF